MRKRALPGIGHVAIVLLEGVAPGVFGVLKTPARGELPFGLGRQLDSSPGGVAQDVHPGHVDDGVVIQAFQVAARTIGMTPVRAGHEGPPLQGVAKIDRTSRRREHHRGRRQHARIRARIVVGVRRILGEGHVGGGGHEAGELAIGHRSGVDPEAVDGGPTRRPFLGIVVVGAHGEHPARDPHHRLAERLPAGRRRWNRHGNVLTWHGWPPPTGRSSDHGRGR